MSESFPRTAALGKMPPLRCRVVSRRCCPGRVPGREATRAQTEPSSKNHALKQRAKAAGVSQGSSSPSTTSALTRPERLAPGPGSARFPAVV